ncbi:MAG: radical SAM protein [Candidatus Omnitrophica bacterium]|nr:radical SAM protein [Candidatus Omnitrophota bacterium]
MNYKEKLKLLKCVAYTLRYRGGDMPYPPLIAWQEILKFQDIKRAWQKISLDILSGRQRQDKVGIYLHIPFCVTKCFYCNCVSFPQLQRSEHKTYLNCLEKEIKLLDFHKEIEIRTFYIGGGTPSIFEDDLLERLMNRVRKSFNLSGCQQIMTEISPYTITRSKIRILTNFGVDKVTLGIQTLDSALLKKLNRPQEKAMVLNAFYQLRKSGMKYINIDLMAGLPQQRTESFIKTLMQILKLKPDTIHINPFFPTSFTLFSSTGHHLGWPDIKKREKMVQIGQKLIRQILPAALEKDELEKENIQLFNSSKFNSSLLGLGWGAGSHIRGRFHYAKNLNFNNYLENLRKNTFPEIFGTSLNQEEEMRANLIHAFEREQQVDRKIFNMLFNQDPLLVFKKEFQSLISLNRIKIESDTIRLITQNRIELFIYSKFFYSPKIMSKLRKIINPGMKEYQNLDFKLAQFYDRD